MKKGLSKLLLCCMIFGMALFALAGCAGQDASEEGNEAQQTVSLAGKNLFVYCGAGMTKPFQEIADAFEAETGATVEITFGNAAQIISQITTTQQGDLFIAGDEGELDKIKEEFVSDTKPLVKHIPVIVVTEGNPKGITTLADFAKEDVRVVLGDNQATPIGKLADKALEKAGVLDQVNIIARSTTAPEIANTLALGECDASILWKENANIDGIEIVEDEEMTQFIKTIPAASLNCSQNQEALSAFLTFLDSKTTTDIWQNYGYELIAE